MYKMSDIAKAIDSCFTKLINNIANTRTPILSKDVVYITDNKKFNASSTEQFLRNAFGLGIDEVATKDILLSSEISDDVSDEISADEAFRFDNTSVDTILGDMVRRVRDKVKMDRTKKQFELYNIIIHFTTYVSFDRINRELDDALKNILYPTAYIYYQGCR